LVGLVAMQTVIADVWQPDHTIVGRFAVVAAVASSAVLWLLSSEFWLSA
jgi:hypothetical protein